MGREEYGAELWEVATPQTPYAHLRISTVRGGSASVIGGSSGGGRVGFGGGGSQSIVGDRVAKDRFPEESRWKNVQRYVSDIYSYSGEEPGSAKYGYGSKPKQGFKSLIYEDVESPEPTDLHQCIQDARRELNLPPVTRGPETPARRDWDRSELSFRSEFPLHRQSVAYTDRRLERVSSSRKSSTVPRSITAEQLAEAVELARLETGEKESPVYKEFALDSYSGLRGERKPSLKNIDDLSPGEENEYEYSKPEKVSPKGKMTPKFASVAKTTLMLNSLKDQFSRIEENDEGLLEPSQEELEMLYSAPGMSPMAGGDSIVGLSKMEQDDSGSLVSGISAQLLWHDDDDEEEDNGYGDITEVSNDQPADEGPKELEKQKAPVVQQANRDNEPRGNEGKDQSFIREEQRDRNAQKAGEESQMGGSREPPYKAGNGDIGEAEMTGQGGDDPDDSKKGRAMAAHAATATATGNSSESPDTATNGPHAKGESSFLSVPKLPPPGLKEPTTKKEQERYMKWMNMMGTRGERWRHTLHKRPLKVRRRVRKGIPCKTRGLAWFLLCGGKDLFEECPGHYEEYKMCTDTPWEAEIIRDITRTFPTEPFFRASDGQGQKALLNVLRSYSVYDAELGYVQGMAFLAGFFLLYMNEEQTFWSMVAVLKGAKHKPLRGIFEHGLPLAQQFFYQFERLLQSECPRLAAHFEKTGMMTSMYASQWFITLFSYSFPRDLVTRIWDIYFLEGEKVLFRVALALLKEREKELIQLRFEPLFVALKEFSDDLLNPDYLLPKALKLKISRRLEQYQMDWLQRENNLSSTNAVPL